MLSPQDCDNLRQSANVWRSNGSAEISTKDGNRGNRDLLYNSFTILILWSRWTGTLKLDGRKGKGAELSLKCFFQVRRRFRKVH